MKHFDPFEYVNDDPDYNLPLKRLIDRARYVALLRVTEVLKQSKRFLVHAEHVYKGEMERSFELSFSTFGLFPTCGVVELCVGDRIWVWFSGSSYKSTYISGKVIGTTPNQVLEIGNDLQPYRFTELESVCLRTGTKSAYPWPIFEQLVKEYCGASGDSQKSKV